MNLSQLNPQQREAVLHRGSPLLILAGAGSGKTRVITTRVAHLLDSGDAQPEHLLAVTFTNRAAAEMKERVAALVGEKHSAKLTVSTFHSFCARLLRLEANALGFTQRFTIYDASDQRTLLGRCLSEFSLAKETFDLGTFVYRISYSKNHGLTPETYESLRMDKYDERIPTLWRAYQQALQARDAMDFDDLLLFTNTLLRDHPAVLQRIRDRYRHVLIDEYQDTNTLQFEIAYRLCEQHRNLCVVGDDDQSIYGFRGAELSNILEFEHRFPDAKVITLDQNYRSTETILRAANAVIARNTNRKEKTLWSQEGVGKPLAIVCANDENDEATFVALYLKELKAELKLKWSDIGVLYRSNIQSRPYEIAFRQNRIPYVVIGGIGFFDRKEVKDLAAYLRVMANSRDDVSLRRIINVPKRGIGDTTLQRLNETAQATHKSLFEVLRNSSALEIPETARQGIRGFVSLIDKTQHVIRDRTLPQGISYLIQESGYLDEVEKTSPTPAAFAVRKEITFDLVNAAETYQQEATQPSLWDFLQNASLATDYKTNSKEQRFEEETVRLMTLHSAKGLEFPVVFLVGVEEGLLPHAKSLTLDTDVFEERRLFYVGITRARRHLVITSAAVRSLRGRTRATQESRFLEEIPVELVDYKQTWDLLPKAPHKIGEGIKG
jgi:superfamily I DNA/RNA helicase